MKKMPGLEVESGIDKNLREGPIRVSSLGLEADEHDPTFHGGPDKAIHGSRLLPMRCSADKVQR
ncbi:LOW QUALITY PROTEIN: MOSC domain-containing protein [Colletotrichum tofieldiae]|nr:LOW QUALITY PROTEIN: MOSC domain-containing protein [Colletotrichum tofieldiae]